jgi:hypothetical protein
MTLQKDFRFRSYRNCFRRLLATTFSAAALFGAVAPEQAQADQGLLSEALFGASEETPFIDVKGWLSQGITFNTTSSSSFNGPVTFNDRSGEYQLNQLSLVFERAVEQSGDDWNLGGRVDLMYGTDSAFTTSVGFDDNITSSSYRYYTMAIPQAYLETNIPVLDGVKFKAGHFYTLIGYEVVPAPDNFFYSHAYTMQYGEPFTHWGGLFSKSFCDGQYTVTAGAVQGWDNLSDTADHNLAFLGGVSAEVAEGTVLTASVISGNEGRSANRTMYSLVLSHQFSDKLKWVAQHDLGVQEVNGGGDAQWYGLNNYLIYSISDTLSTGFRAEWFNDDDGVRVAGLRSGYGGRGNYYGLTWGVNVNPVSYLTIRPELRYDFVRSPKSNGFGKADENDQLLVGLDAIFKF